MIVLDHPLSQIKSWIVPKVNIRQSLYSIPMLTKDNNLDVFLLSPEEFRLKSVMLLGQVTSELKKILFSINNQPRIINIHIIANPQLGAVVIHSHAVKLAFDTFPLFFVFPCINLDCQKGISSAMPSGTFTKSVAPAEGLFKSLGSGTFAESALSSSQNQRSL